MRAAAPAGDWRLLSPVPAPAVGELFSWAVHAARVKDQGPDDSTAPDPVLDDDAEETDLTERARKTARKLLRKELPERWQHTLGVARRAAELAGAVPRDEGPLLIAAAWLHDIGYSSELQLTGFHPIDGGLYLRERGWDSRLVALVAHHSGARFVPVDRGFSEIMATFPFEESPLSDALTYADQTVGPNGVRMTVEYRIAEAITRHGPDSPNARARVDRVPYLLAAAQRVRDRLHHVGQSAG